MDDERIPRLYYPEVTPERPDAQWKSQSLDQLAERFRRAGVADDPHYWARSEIEEDFAQYPRFVFLKLLWRLMFELQDSCVEAVGEVPGGEDLVAGHAEEVAKALAGPIGLFAHQVLYLLGGDVEGFGHVPEDDEPGWRLMEEIGGQLTGRPVSALEEAVRGTHPEGEAGAESGGWYS